MDVKIENGAISYTESCVPRYISSVDEIVQRVKLACCMRKGDFSLCKNLGCFDYKLNPSDEMLEQKLTMIFEEATINIPYSDLEVVHCEEKDSKIVAKIKISCNDKTAYTEVSIDV